MSYGFFELPDGGDMRRLDALPAGVSRVHFTGRKQVEIGALADGTIVKAAARYENDKTLLSIDNEHLPRLYKVTGGEGQPIYGGSSGFRWSFPHDGEPGEWMEETNALVPYSCGLHVTNAKYVSNFVSGARYRLFEAEVDGPILVLDEAKASARRARLIREIHVRPGFQWHRPVRWSESAVLNVAHDQAQIEHLSLALKPSLRARYLRLKSRPSRLMYKKVLALAEIAPGEDPKAALQRLGNMRAHAAKAANNLSRARESYEAATGEKFPDKMEQKRLDLIRVARMLESVYATMRWYDLTQFLKDPALLASVEARAQELIPEIDAANAADVDSWDAEFAAMQEEVAA